MAIKPQTIFRIHKGRDNPFVMVDRRPVENPEMSFKAKGILTYLLSRPDNWEVNLPDLLKHSTDGADSIRTGLRELRKAGHARLVPHRNEARQVVKWVYEVYEQQIPQDQRDSLGKRKQPKPDRENPHLANAPEARSGFSTTGKATTGKSDPNNTELNKTDLTNMGADAPARHTDAKKKGDIWDGMQHYAEQGLIQALSRKTTPEILEKVNQFPQDCQATLLWLTNHYHWAPEAIPGQQRGKGGPFGQWVMEIREINYRLAGTGEAGLKAIAKACSEIIVSHPGAMTWAVNGAVGKVREKSTQAKSPDLTPFQRQLQKERQPQGQDA